VFPGGLAILAEVFSVLDIKEMRMAEGAMLRVCCTTCSAGTGARMRASAPCAPCSSAITSTSSRRARRSNRAQLLEQTRATWHLEEPLAHLALKWAARLHEIGLDVSHSGYHRHGAYLLENADMPGFPREEQRLLARLSALTAASSPSRAWKKLVPPWDRSALHLIVLLRLAVLCTAAEAPRRCRRLICRRRHARWKYAFRPTGSRSIR